MFDQSHILNHYLKKIEKQTSLVLNPQSAFNNSLDRRLRKLVFLYRFNFQAIALHLIQEFPQFQYKLSKNSVAYRWCQLSVEQKFGKIPILQTINKVQTQKSQKNIDQLNKQQSQTSKIIVQSNIKQNKRPFKSKYQYQQSESEQSQQLQLQICHKTPCSPQKINPDPNLLELQRALQEAQSLENEEQGFMSYKPKYETILDRKGSIQEKQVDQLQDLISKINERKQKETQKCEKNEQNQIITTKKRENIFEEDYLYGNNYNYSQLEEEYNHYNNIINNYGFGFHEDSVTDSGSQTDTEQQPQNQVKHLNNINDQKKRNQPQIQAKQQKQNSQQDLQIEFYTICPNTDQEYIDKQHPNQFQ